MKKGTTNLRNVFKCFDTGWIILSEILRNLSKEEISIVIEKNRFEVNRNLWLRFNAIKRETKEYTLYASEHKFPLLNGVIETNIDKERVDEKIDEVISHFEKLQLPFNWITGVTTKPRNIYENLEKKGFNITKVPGMALNLKQIEKIKSVNSNIEIHKVENLDQKKKISIVGQKVYGFPEEVFLLELNGVQTDEYGVYYLALLDGEPVGMSAVFYYCGVAGIYNVGVVEEARRKGIGSAITFAPINDAKDLGYELAILYSTELGINVYKKMGFEQYNTGEVCTWIPNQ